MAADATLAVWALLELGVRVREGVRGVGRSDRDRGTRIFVAVSLGAAVGLAQVLRTSAPPRAAGIAVMWLGLALRVWAIATLGDSFRTTVQVAPGQAVVTRGPYRWVRHPSYLALLLIVAGYGLAVGGWPSVIVGLAVPLPAVVWRIRVEEAELERVLGEPYRSYRVGRARLIPRLW